MNRIPPFTCSHSKPLLASSWLLRTSSHFPSPPSWEFPWSFIGMERGRTKLTYGRWEHVSWARGWVGGWKQTTKGWPSKSPCTKQDKQTLHKQMVPSGSDGEGLGHGSDRFHLQYYSDQDTNASYSRLIQSPTHRNQIWTPTMCLSILGSWRWGQLGSTAWPD